MSDSIFRKKSLDHISSPEEIDDYIKVTKPGMWLVLAAIVLMLTAVIIWGIVGGSGNGDGCAYFIFCQLIMKDK